MKFENWEKLIQSADEKDVRQKSGMYFVQKARDNANQIGFRHGYQFAEHSSVQYMIDNGWQFAGNDSHQSGQSNMRQFGKDRAHQTAYDYAYQEAGEYAHQFSGINSVHKAKRHSEINTKMKKCSTLIVRLGSNCRLNIYDEDYMIKSSYERLNPGMTYVFVKNSEGSIYIPNRYDGSRFETEHYKQERQDLEIQVVGVKEGEEETEGNFFFSRILSKNNKDVYRFIVMDKDGKMLTENQFKAEVFKLYGYCYRYTSNIFVLQSIDSDFEMYGGKFLKRMFLFENRPANFVTMSYQTPYDY